MRTRVGPFAGGIRESVDGVARFDNLVASTWDYDCGALCTAWPVAWDQSFSGAVEDIDLKYFYTGSVVDPRYGYIFRKDWTDYLVDVTCETSGTVVAAKARTTNVISHSAR